MNRHEFSDSFTQIPDRQWDSMNINEPGQEKPSVSFSSDFPTSARQSCILFDLDGVLIDTRPLIAGALADVAIVLNVEPPTEDVLLEALTLSPRRAVRMLFPEHEVATSMFQAAINRSASVLAPCPGVKTLLEQWRCERIGVVTSRNQADAQLYLTCSGLNHFFQVVIAWGHTSRHKPHPDPLLAAARRLGQTTGIYVGDSPDDMRAALAGNFYPIGAIWASQWSRTQLIEAGATFIAEHPGAILNHLREREG